MASMGGRRARVLRALALAAAALAAPGCGGPGERVLVTVGEHRVTVSDFEAAARHLPDLGMLPPDAAKKRLLDELIDRTEMVAEAHRRGYDHGPEFLEARRRAENEVLPARLYARVVGDRVRVSEAEIRAIWKHQDREWKLSQIFLFTEAEARAARNRLERGEPFAQVARSASRDVTSAPRGGDLGFVTAGQIPTQIEQAIADLPPGRWKGPLRTPIGYYFVQVTERRARKPDPFELVSQPLSGMLRQRKERSLVLEYLERLKQRHHLRRDEGGFEVLAAKWQNRFPEDLMASGGDLHKLGFTDADLARTLVVYDGGGYTIREFFADFLGANTLERPPGTDDTTLRLYVDDRAVSHLIMRDARERGIDREPDTQRELRDREESYLINKLYEQVVVPSSELTPEEREQLRAAAGMGRGGSTSGNGELAQQEAQWAEAKRLRVLKGFLARLRKETPPRIDEKALAEVPWPVPSKENA